MANIINYDYGNYPQFDCYIRGKIVLTQAEWAEAKKAVLRHRGFPTYYPWIKPTFKADIKREVKSKNGMIYNVRVSATEVIIRKFGLQKKYKQNNYIVEVLK